MAGPLLASRGVKCPQAGGYPTACACFRQLRPWLAKLSGQGLEALYLALSGHGFGTFLSFTTFLAAVQSVASLSWLLALFRAPWLMNFFCLPAAVPYFTCVLALWSLFSTAINLLFSEPTCFVSRFFYSKSDRALRYRTRQHNWECHRLDPSWAGSKISVCFGLPLHLQMKHCSETLGLYFMVSSWLTSAQSRLRSTAETLKTVMLVFKTYLLCQSSK